MLIEFYVETKPTSNIKSYKTGRKKVVPRLHACKTIQIPDCCLFVRLPDGA